MAFLWRAVLLGIILCANDCSGHITITGHETPLIIGLSRDIVCTWSGEENATTIEWFLSGLDAGPIESTINSNSLVLSPDVNARGLNGAVLVCRVTTSTGSQFEESITVEVKELENSISISTSTTTPTAGGSFTLTCTVTSDIPSQVMWLDPNGQPVRGPEITVSRNVTSGMVTTVDVTFSPLRTSHSGIYTCISSISDPPSREDATYLIVPQIPPPTVTIVREPAHPVQLLTGNRLVLTCVIQMIPEVDTPVTISSQWTGHSSLSDDEGRVSVSDLDGFYPVYQLYVTFSTILLSDSGSYVCSANALTNISGEIVESTWTSETVELTVTMGVTIEVSYNPPSDFTLPSPPYYRPATSVTLTCHAHGNVTYQWTSTCSSCFASRVSSQSISRNILTSGDAGIHTCTATDNNGITGSNSTEMKLIGAGIYVINSETHKYTAVPNNALIVRDSSCSYSCRQVDFYCYSNSTSTSVGYIYFPNDRQVYSANSFYDMMISRVSPGGIHARNYYGNTPDVWGIYTCQIPDSLGRTIETNIGIYSSMPSAPYISSSYYRDSYNYWSRREVGSIMCRTRYSPPTTVTWQRDGVTVRVDGDRYGMTQTVTSYSRRSSYYDNILLINNATDLVGNHVFTCSISNYAGDTAASVSASTRVVPRVSISSSRESIHGVPYFLSCAASLQNLHYRVSNQLTKYLVFNWIGPDGLELTEENGITVEQQYTTRTRLNFRSLDMIHGGLYQCVATLVVPNAGVTYNSRAEYNLIVKKRTTIQLKFGPVPHCSMWFQYDSIASNLERDVKRALGGVIDKDNCSCLSDVYTFTNGEFSCQTTTSDVVFRANIDVNTEARPTEELLAHVQKWLTDDGTFLSATSYDSRANVRLKAQPFCPLVVRSFSEPECEASEDLDRPAAHLPADEL